jgi:hypothetical protein
VQPHRDFYFPATTSTSRTPSIFRGSFSTFHTIHGAVKFLLSNVFRSLLSGLVSQLNHCITFFRSEKKIERNHPWGEGLVIVGANLRCWFFTRTRMDDNGASLRRSSSGRVLLPGAVATTLSNILFIAPGLRPGTASFSQNRVYFILEFVRSSLAAHATISPTWQEGDKICKLVHS